MPANKGGDSKQGLIIGLVVCILFIIILGVVAYYGYADQAALQAKEKDAMQKEASAKKDREWQKYMAMEIRRFAGHELKNDRNDLPALRNQQPSGDEKAEFDKIVEALNKKMRGGKDRPFESYDQRVARLETELTESRITLDKEKLTLLKTRADYKIMEDTKQREVDEWKKKFDGAQQAHLAAQKKLADDYQAKIDELGDLSRQLADAKKKSEEQIGLRDREIKQLRAMVKDLQEATARLNDRLTPPNFLKFSAPKGKITRLEPKGEMAWIDLGSADNIRSTQNLTFSIFGTGRDGKSSTDAPKGALEVVEVLGPHFSMARITEVRDPKANPITTGDLLINPAWSPDARERVAVAGLIDLTGDGNDYSEEFMRNLRKQGVIIDAYLDLRDLTIKGEGITAKTDYLILGEQPDFVGELREGNRRAERSKEVLDKVAEMQTKARDLGVNIVKFRNFVALTGYKLPRGASIQGRFNYDSQRSAPPAPKPSNGAPKPAEGK